MKYRILIDCDIATGGRYTIYLIDDKNQMKQQSTTLNSIITDISRIFATNLIQYEQVSSIDITGLPEYIEYVAEKIYNESPYDYNVRCFSLNNNKPYKIYNKEDLK